MKRGVSIRMPAVVLITALLVCAFGLAGCQNDLLKEGGTVHFPEGPEFDVTAEAVEGGVMLSWADVAGLSFQVYRTDTATGTVEDLGTPTLVESTYTLRDMVHEQNQIKPATKYQYEVIGMWTAGGKDPRSVVKDVTTQETFPAKGTKVAAPKNVTMTMNTSADVENRYSIITVKITPPDSGIIPSGYSFVLYEDGIWSDPSGFTRTSLNTYEKTVDWADLTDGSSYMVAAYSNGVNDFYSGYNVAYYPGSDYVFSEELTYENLFGSNTSTWIDLNSGSIMGTGGDSDKLVDIYVSMQLEANRFKQGVTYTFERMERVPGSAVWGAFSAVTFETRAWNNDTSTYDYTPLTNGLTIDILGNVTELSLYDRTVSDGKIYQYRIVAKKGDKSQIQPLYRDITIEQRNFAFAYITIEKTVDTKTKFDFTVDASVRDALKADDKLVLYWVKTTKSDGYERGPYTATNKLEFTKTEMEVASPVAKSFEDDNNAGGEYIFVQAYLELADGTRKNIGSSSYSLSGSGFSGYSSSYMLADENISFFALSY